LLLRVSFRKTPLRQIGRGRRTVAGAYQARRGSEVLRSELYAGKRDSFGSRRFQRCADARENRAGAWQLVCENERLACDSRTFHGKRQKTLAGRQGGFNANFFCDW